MSVDYVNSLNIVLCYCRISSADVSLNISASCQSKHEVPKCQVCKLSIYFNHFTVHSWQAKDFAVEE